MHELPHVYSRLEHESGVSPVGVMELNRAVQTYRAARPEFGSDLAHEFKISMLATSFLK
jgi:hypothetical protein